MTGAFSPSSIGQMHLWETCNHPFAPAHWSLPSPGGDAPLRIPDMPGNLQPWPSRHAERHIYDACRPVDLRKPFLFNGRPSSCFCAAIRAWLSDATELNVLPAGLAPSTDRTAESHRTSFSTATSRPPCLLECLREVRGRHEYGILFPPKVAQPQSGLHLHGY